MSESREIVLSTHLNGVARVIDTSLAEAPLFLGIDGGGSKVSLRQDSATFAIF